MTADLDTNEVLVFNLDAGALESGANYRSAPVFHQYGRLAIADFPGDVAQSLAAPSENDAGLTLTEQLGRQGFERRSQMTATKQDRPYQGLSWHGAQGPGPIHPPGQARSSRTRKDPRPPRPSPARRCLPA